MLDIKTQRTNAGIHKDDYLFTFNNMPVRQFASQGQQKSFVISLKLAQLDFFAGHLGFHPILLLDDIFDRLDYFRVKKIMSYLKELQELQVFMSHTSKKQLDDLLSSIGFSYQNLEIERGKIVD